MKSGWYVSWTESIRGSLNNIFFFRLSDKYFLHIKICRCGIFHPNSIHAQYKLLCLISKLNPDTSLSASLEVDWHEIPPQHSLLHLMQTGLVSALPVQMELVCRVNSGNGHLSLSGGHCQQTTCSPPSHCVWNVSIVMTTQMDTGVILSIGHEAGVWTHCDHYNGNSIKSKTTVIE